MSWNIELLLIVVVSSQFYYNKNVCTTDTPYLQNCLSVFMVS